MEDETRPLVSIVIPTYNRAEIILNILIDVQSQTYTNFECMVIDDGSEDNTRVIVEKFCKNDLRFSYNKNIRSKGAPGARNTGLALAKGKLISFFDSDDKMLPNYLENKIFYFVSQPKMDLVISLCKWIKNGQETNYTNIPTEIHPLIRFYSLEPFVDIPWLTPTLIKRSFLIENKIKWDETVQLHQDIQFNINVLAKNPVFIWIKKHDWCWNFDKYDNNIGKTKFNEEEIVRKLIEIYWTNLINTEVNSALKKRVQKQYSHQLVAFCDRLSLSLFNVSEFLKFLKSKSEFNSLDIWFLEKRFQFIKTLPLSMQQRILWKITRLYFKFLFPPIVKEGNYLKKSGIQ